MLFLLWLMFIETDFINIVVLVFQFWASYPINQIQIFRRLEFDNFFKAGATKETTHFHMYLSVCHSCNKAGLRLLEYGVRYPKTKSTEKPTFYLFFLYWRLWDVTRWFSFSPWHLSCVLAVDRYTILSISMI